MILLTLKQKLNEPFMELDNVISKMNKGMTKSDINVFHVPEDYFLTFGDNRTQSADSRQCF